MIRNQSIELFVKGIVLAIGKDQALTSGEFYPSSDKNAIYRCRLNNTTGFLMDVGLFSVLIGFFTFFIVQWIALIVVPLSWVLLTPWLTPKHYRFIQINKHSVVLGTGSILALFQSRFKSLYRVDRGRYNDIFHLRLDLWIRKKFGGKLDSFGRIEIKINDSKPIFRILIETDDFTRLVKILESYRFDTKVQKNRARDELLLVFPSSPRYTKKG